MPRGPKGEKRPGDVIGAAIKVAKIATGEIEDTKRVTNPHAAALGKLGGSKGGKARAAKLSPQQRKKAARKAAKARWADSPASMQPPQSTKTSRRRLSKPKT